MFRERNCKNYFLNNWRNCHFLEIVDMCTNQITWSSNFSLWLQLNFLIELYLHYHQLLFSDLSIIPFRDFVTISKQNKNLVIQFKNLHNWVLYDCALCKLLSWLIFASSLPPSLILVSLNSTCLEVTATVPVVWTVCY